MTYRKNLNWFDCAIRRKGNRFVPAATSRLVSAMLNIVPYKVIWDPGSWVFDALIWNWIPDSLWVEFGFRIPSIVSGIRGSLSWIPGSKAQDSGFSQILESK